jgi:hypothetical protein
LNINAAPFACLDSQMVGQGRGLQSSGPDDDMAVNPAPVGEHYMPSPYLFHRRAQARLYTTLFQHLSRMGLRFSRETVQDSVSSIHQQNLPSRDIDIRERSLQRVMKSVAKGPRHFCAGGSSSHDHKVQRTLVNQRGIPICRLQHSDDARTQRLGIA